jgi:hypothetical protein
MFINTIYELTAVGRYVNIVETISDADGNVLYTLRSPEGDRFAIEDHRANSVVPGPAIPQHPIEPGSVGLVSRPDWTGWDELGRGRFNGRDITRLSRTAIFTADISAPTSGTRLPVLFDLEPVAERVELQVDDQTGSALTFSRYIIEGDGREVLVERMETLINRKEG